jgi:hypothetical protein
MSTVYQIYMPAPVRNSKSEIKGALLLVNGDIRRDTMPLDRHQCAGLVRTLEGMIGRYEESGLPPKVFYFAYTGSKLLCLITRRSQLIIWLEPSANISKLENEARKLIATAHLKGSLASTSLIFAEPTATEPISNAVTAPTVIREELATPPAKKTQKAKTSAQPKPAETLSPTNLNEIMNWKEASQAIEGILSKVLSQAQAARMIEAAFKLRGIDMESNLDATLLSQAGSDILAKVPNKVLRQSLTKEFEAIVARIS